MTARILVVEDDDKFAELLVRAFGRSGFDAVHRCTGDAALRALQAEPPFDAAVLDVMIPHPDGLEVCRHLRSLQSDVGIVAISARVGAEHRARARAAGADAFLAKPFRLQDLVLVTSELIARGIPAGARR